MGVDESRWDEDRMATVSGLISARIRARRVSLPGGGRKGELTQPDLAMRLRGIGVSTLNVGRISRIENGVNPTPVEFLGLCKALDCDPLYLLGLRDDPGEWKEEWDARLTRVYLQGQTHDLVVYDNPKPQKGKTSGMNALLVGIAGGLFLLLSAASSSGILS